MISASRGDTFILYVKSFTILMMCLQTGTRRIPSVLFEYTSYDDVIISLLLEFYLDK